jgi:primosomal protein N' (replication factor Y)
VIIGTRSAVFTPLARPGLFIIDEEHDPSFKQQDGFRYSARDLAILRARDAGVPIVLGTATPSLETLYNCRRGRYTHLHLPQRAGLAVAPKIGLIDVRKQPMEQLISIGLRERMRHHLQQQDGQVLLFLNRRGFAPMLICHDCGWVSQCERCDSRMTLHQQINRLRCHHCAREQRVPASCPACQGEDLRSFGYGTERIEQALQQQFPDYPVLRIDRDTTRRKGAMQDLLAKVHAGEGRILLGTQMLAKGHHFPNVTLVGILDADYGLYSIDLRASERMAQLIMQVAGRAGRAEKPGEVLIQTHHPEHPLLQTLIRQGYGECAELLLQERKASHWPPYSYLALLRADATDKQIPMAFLAEAVKLAGDMAGRGCELLGPIPSPMERRAGRYRAQLLIQADQRQALQQFLGPWLAQLEGLKTGRKVRWSIDVDPAELF